MRDGDEYVVNGHKIFTSGANKADYVWLACRTDPDAPKHKGISILIVPSDDPGFTWTPIRAVGGMTATATYYDDVRVPADDVVGEVNEGWRLITTQLNHERVGLAALGGRMIQLWEQTSWSGRKDDGVDRACRGCQQDLARTHAQLEAMRLLNWRMTAAVADGTLSGPTAVGGQGLRHRDPRRRLPHPAQVLGAGGRVRPGSPGAVLHGQVEQRRRQGTSTRSAAGSTRCSARSSPPPASA